MSDRDGLQAYYDLTTSSGGLEEDADWVETHVSGVAEHRGQFACTLQELSLQREVIDLIADGGRIGFPLNTCSSGGGDRGRGPIPLGIEVKRQLDEAFPSNKDSSRKRLSLKEYSKLLSLLAFAKDEQRLSEIVPNPTGINRQGLCLKGMTWQSSLKQLVVFCQRSAKDDKGGITQIFLAETIEEVFISEQIIFVMGYYQNRLTAGRTLLLERQGSLGPAGISGHMADGRSMTTSVPPRDNLDRIEAMFGIKLRDNALPLDFMDGKKGLLDDLAKNCKLESQEMFWRASRVYQCLDLRDYRHLHLMIVAQMLFLHTPPPEVLIKSQLRYSFTKNRPNSRNTKWLAVVVLLGLLKIHEKEMMRFSSQQEGDPKNLMTKIGKYNVTGRLMLRAGLFTDFGQSGELKNFNNWQFVTLTESEMTVARIRRAATEGPLPFLMTVWPKDIAEDILGWTL